MNESGIFSLTALTIVFGLVVALVASTVALATWQTGQFATNTVALAAAADGSRAIMPSSLPGGRPTLDTAMATRLAEVSAARNGTALGLTMRAFAASTYVGGQTDTTTGYSFGRPGVGVQLQTTQGPFSFTAAADAELSWNP